MNFIVLGILCKIWIQIDDFKGWYKIEIQIVIKNMYYVYFLINSLKSKESKSVEFIFAIILGILCKIWIQFDDFREWFKFKLL